MSVPLLKQSAYYAAFFFGVFMIFMVSGFNFHSFNADWPYYLSEIACSGPSAERTCGDSVHPLTDLFRDASTQNSQVYDYGVRYTSASFAELLNLFTRSEDTLNVVAFKVSVIKSMIAAYFLTYSFYLSKTFPKTHSILKNLLIAVFAFPYTLFMTSSVYPASIATVAMLAVLVSLAVYETELRASLNLSILLIVNIVLAFSVILANRFETSVFCSVAIALFFIRRLILKTVSVFVALVPALCLAVSLLFIQQNSVLQSWISRTLRGEAKVLSPETAGSSVIVGKIGDAGLSATGLITAVDNSSRNLMDAVASSQPILFLPVILAVSWIPLALLVSQKVYQSVRPSGVDRVSRRQYLASLLPTAVLVTLFVGIPYFARTIWFFHYVAPLLASLVYFSDTLQERRSSPRLFILTAYLANSLIFFLVTVRNGSLFFKNLTVGVVWQIATFFSASFILWSLTCRASPSRDSRA